MNNTSVKKILDMCSELDGRKERITFLKNNMNDELRKVFDVVFYDDIEFRDIDWGSYMNVCKCDEESVSLVYVLNRIKIFSNDADSNDEKMKKLFGQYTEMLLKDDAEILVKILSKDLKEYGITKKMIEKCLE